MNNDNSSRSTTSGDVVPPNRAPHRLLAVLPAATFVLGAILGGVVVGVAGDDESGPGAGETAEPSPSGTSAPSAGDTAVVVPGECIAVADTVDELTSEIRDNVDAIREFRSQRIVEMLNRLEDLDQQARDQAAACRDVQVRSVSPGPDAGSSAVPSETPG